MSTFPARPVTIGPRRAGLFWAQTSRIGGVSEGAYASFNLADHVGELPETTAHNWDILQDLTGWSRDEVATCRQVHGARIVEVARGGLQPAEADALISRTRGVSVGVFTADCVPVLMAHPPTGTVAAVHCGWRGAALGLASRTLAQLLQVEISQLDVCAAVGGVEIWIGAHIAQCSYEVDHDVAEQFAQEVLRKRNHEKWELDVAGAVERELLSAGVNPEKLVKSAVDTYTDSSYYSYRRDGAMTGRMLSWVGFRS